MPQPFTLIPAIDLLDGKCVRLTKGDYSKSTVYHPDPLEVAKSFEDAGLTRLHLVDLEGARSGHIVHHRVLERIATRTNLVIDFGGGLQSRDDLEIAFQSGAQMVTGGSIAVKKPHEFESWIAAFGAHRILLGADVRNGMIAVSGWTEATTQALIPFIESYVQKGIRTAICTDIARDGMLQGPAVELYRSILEKIPDLNLVASGGVSSIDDLQLLADAGVPSAIVGKALYENKIKLTDLKRFL